MTSSLEDQVSDRMRLPFTAVVKTWEEFTVGEKSKPSGKCRVSNIKTVHRSGSEEICTSQLKIHI